MRGEQPTGQAAKALEMLRRICAALEGATEVPSWGHPNYKVGKKTFAAFERYRGEWVVAFKAEPAQQQFLIETDPRCYASPYAGGKGWVSLRVEGKVSQRELAPLIRGSYALVLPVKRRRA
jgi:predicted DNA-binding protein (MmcQ/YjbR family)